MDRDRLASIRRAYVEADEKEGATNDKCLMAVYQALPDATREEISVVLEEYAAQLGRERQFALRLRTLFPDDPGFVVDFLLGKTARH